MKKRLFTIIREGSSSSIKRRLLAAKGTKNYLYCRMLKISFSVPPENREPLANLLKGLPEIAPGRRETLIRQGSVWQGNTRLKDPLFVPPEGSLLVFYPEKPIVEYCLSPERIIFEDDDLLIADKEAGINTCQSVFSDYDCLTWGVQKLFSQRNIDYEVQTINRLDRATQGLVLYAKNKACEQRLHELFRNGKIQKTYLALCESFEGVKNGYVLKDTLQHKGKVKPALSYVKFLGTKKLPSGGEVFAFLVFPQTGRTHQIRKHFAAYLRPILGDAAYGPYSPEDLLHLRCCSYRFIHPVTGKRIRISAFSRA